jgi:ABC-type multidrug transport system ATPase subunit
MISLINFGKSYKQRLNKWAVKDFSLDIEKGTFVIFNKNQRVKLFA